MAAFGRFCLGLCLCLIAFSLLGFCFVFAGYPVTSASADHWFGVLSVIVGVQIWKAVNV